MVRQCRIYLGRPPDLVTILVIKKGVDNEQFICNINSSYIFIFINIMYRRGLNMFMVDFCGVGWLEFNCEKDVNDFKLAWPNHVKKVVKIY